MRREDGSWNDRVFARSANYGTSMAMLAIMAEDTPPPATLLGGVEKTVDDRVDE